MKKQISVTQFTVAADNQITLHNDKGNGQSVAAASSSVNLS